MFNWVYRIPYVTSLVFQTCFIVFAIYCNCVYWVNYVSETGYGKCGGENDLQISGWIGQK
jgi:hypothetical protein